MSLLHSTPCVDCLSKVTLEMAAPYLVGVDGSALQVLGKAIVLTFEKTSVPSYIATRRA